MNSLSKIEVYSSWNEISNQSNKHGRLFHLNLLGLDTPYVEAFTSYLARLANAHSISIYSLVAREIVPLVKDSHLCIEGEHIHKHLGGNWWKKLAVALNGVNASTAEWVTLLQILTQRNDLQFTTMLRWRELVSHRNLIRKTHAWCSVCYDEWYQKSEIIYNPLLWSLKSVEVCDKHKSRLRTHCNYPDCHKTFPSLTSDMHVGFCPHCSRWLGARENEHDNLRDAMQEKKQQWVVSIVKELILASPSISNIPQWKTISATFAHFILDEFDGNFSAVAREVKMHRTSIGELANGTQLPQMETLLKICHLLKRSVLNLCTDSIDTGEWERPFDKNSQEPANRPQRRMDRNIILKELRQAALEIPVPMSSVAKRLDYNQSFLYHHFPEECQAISARHKQFKHDLSVQRSEKLCKEVEALVHKLHSEGVYPSQRQVGKVLGRGIFKDVTVYKVYIAALRQLGYRVLAQSF